MKKYVLILSLLFILISLLSGCSSTSTNDSEAIERNETYVDLDSTEDIKEYELLTGYWKAEDQTLPTGVKSNIELEFEEDKTFSLLLFYLDENGEQESQDPNATYRGLYDLVLNSNQITFDINIVTEDGQIYTGDEVKNEVENIPEITTCEYTVSEDNLNLKSNIINLHFVKSYDF